MNDTSWVSFVPHYVASDLLNGLNPVGRVERLKVVGLFVDVSGFTAISEGLAKTGKAGAEELTTILNSYFEPMIALITSYGGIIGKFGGDAMTVLFPYARPQNAGATARRAIQCALDMQANMGRYQAIEASSGVFKLAMKAGLAIGPVMTTTVGYEAAEPSNTRLEYLIAGRVLDLCADAEHHASQGEVVVHNDLLRELLPDSVQIVEGRGDFSCVGSLQRRSARAPLPALPELPLAAIETIASYLHPSLAERLHEGQTGFINEHRKVTILFVSFGGFDYDTDPTVSDKLQAYLSGVIAIIQGYDGYLNKVDMGDKGSKYIVLFGAPVAHENDEERALLCALDLIAQAADHLVSIRIGLNTGFVYCGQVGSTLRQEYTVMGDAVNLSARMMQAAQPGQIMVSGFTHRYAAPKFNWQDLSPIKVKGKSDLIPVHVLQGVKPPEETIGKRLQEPTFALPMVGREAELQRVADRLERVLRGRGQLVGITAEAGMGKSRLSAEIIKLANARGLSGYSGECLSHATNNSYQVWHSIWRRLFGLNLDWSAERQVRHLSEQLSAVDSGLAQRLPLLALLLNLPIPDNELTRSLDAKLRKASLEALLVDYLRTRASGTPLLLVLEDCHWIDPLSQDLLEVIGRNLADLPVLLLVVYRPTDAAGYFRLNALKQLAHFEEISLATFTPPQAQELIELKLQQLFANTTWEAENRTLLVERITDKGQGNPFYIEELVNLLQDKQIDPNDAEALANLELPDSLYSLIISRIDQLAEGEKITLKVASVIGRLFRADWLWGAYPQLGTPQRVKEQLTTLSQRDLAQIDRPEPELEYLFKHIITQEVAYESLAVATRKTLHEDIGQFVERRYPENLASFLNTLAFHYGRSENSDKQREYFRKAGEAAQSAYSNDAAIDYYRRLQPLLPEAEQVEVVMKQAEVWQLTGKWPEAEELYRQALALAESTDNPKAQAACQRAIGALLHFKGSRPEALHWLEVARQGFERLADQEGISHAVGNIGMVYAQQGDYPRALECYEQQLAIATRLDFHPSISAAIGNIGSVYRYQGDYERASSYYRRKIEFDTTTNERVGASIALGNLGIVYRQQGDFSNALSCFQQKLQRDTEIGDRQSASKVVGNMGLIYQEQGYYSDALACHQYLLQAASQSYDRRTATICIGNMADVYTEQTNYAQAELLYKLAINLCRTLKIPHPLCDFLHSNAVLYFQQNRYTEAHWLNEEALQLANELRRKDIQTKIKLLALSLQFHLHNLTKEAVISKLNDLLNEGMLETAEEAAIYYQLGKYSENQANCYQSAANLYLSLYQKTPKSEYRQRYTELTGEILPASPALPDLPELVTRNQTSLDALLERVEVML